jgi:hypothetical protein
MRMSELLQDIREQYRTLLKDAERERPVPEQETMRDDKGG